MKKGFSGSDLSAMKDENQVYMFVSWAKGYLPYALGHADLADSGRNHRVLGGPSPLAARHHGPLMGLIIDSRSSYDTASDAVS